MEKNNKNTAVNQPEKKFSTGVVSATIWKNNGTSKRDNSPVEYRTITLQRSYKDKDGSWKTTSSLRLNDLPKAALVLNKAYEYLVMREEKTPSRSNDQNEVEINEEIVM